MKVAGKNTSIQDGQHLETLAFLLGHSENDNLIATDLIFPKQDGQAHKVDDQGKLMIRYCVLYTKCQLLFNFAKLITIFLLYRY